MSLIVDTGSTWSWLTSEDCKGCPGSHYEYHKSTNYKDYDIKESIKYMKGRVRGQIVHDSVSLSNSLLYATKNFKFVSVDHSSISTLKCDGLLGLSPKAGEGNSGT